MSKRLILALVLFAVWVHCRLLGAQEKVIVSYEFESGPELSAYTGLKFDAVKGEIVRPGVNGQGHCLRIANSEPGAYAALEIAQPIAVQKNLMLSFDHREEVEGGKAGQYLGVMLSDAEGKEFWTCDQFSNEWRHFEIPIASIRPSSHSVGAEMKIGKVIRRIRLYGRSKDREKVRMTVWFDNIQLVCKPRLGTMSEKTRISYSNPPLFNWPLGEGKQRLQYSRRADFPEGATFSVEVTRNFYLPHTPLDPGVWYWRVWISTPLLEGWSDVERIEVLPEAHRFAVERVPFETLLKKPRPRLLEAALLDEELNTAKPEALAQRAEGIYKQGVQPHPGPYREGNPEWRAWIEWYGKVAGRITGGTGRRLETIAKIAMLTKDPKIVQWTKELALAACEWDPEGGSAMRYGDIGAHHLLRGLNHCYDVCYDAMTPAEREKVKSILVARANQFSKSLNPFRGHEANNHAWLQAFGLAESGIVLLGEHHEAQDWVEYVLNLYVSRFLPCMGYQGDNNEGLSYWAYGLGFIVDYADMMKAVCGIDLYKHPWLRQTARFPMYCALPHGSGVSFADTGMPNHGMIGPVAKRLVRQLALRTQDPYALWYSGERKAVDGLVPRPPADLPQSIHYRHIGWVVFNTTLLDGRDAVTVAMHSGKYYAGHQHPDQNSFVIHAYGDKLAIDGGYYDWYGSPHFKAYSAQTIAHNTLMVNGQGQVPFREGADGKVTAYFDSPGYGYACGDASDPEIYKGLLRQFDRHVLFIKPDFVMIHDEVASSGQPARFDWLFHAVVPIEADASSGRFSVTCPKAALQAQFLSPQDLTMRVTKGFPVEPVNGYSTDPVPPEKYVSEWTLTAAPREPLVEAEFLVVMQVQRLGEGTPPVARVQTEPAENAHGVSFKLGQCSHLVLFRKKNAVGPMKAAGLESDGDIAAIEVGAGGEVRRAFLHAGKSLRFNGKVIFERPKRSTCSLLVTNRGGVETDENTANSAFGRPLTGSRLVVNGAASTLEGYEQLQADGVYCVWWGEVNVPQSDFYDFTCEGWTGQQSPRMILDGVGVDVSIGKKPHYSSWLAEGSHWVTVMGRGTMAGLILKGQGATPVRAQMLPKDFKPSQRGLVIEAERPSVEGDVKGKIVEKVGASGGLAHCSWDTDGQWAEWQFIVPKTGQYQLLIRAAGEHDGVLREVRLDGEPLFAGLRVLRFDATGGWCRTRDDWRYFAAPAPIRLVEGPHTLRFQRITGSMNLDHFVLLEVR